MTVWAILSSRARSLVARTEEPTGSKPARNPEVRPRVEVAIGFYASVMGLVLALLAGHNVAERVVSAILCLTGLGLSAHGARLLRRVRRTRHEPTHAVPYALRELTALEDAAVASVSSLERALYGGRVRAVSDLSSRPGNKIATFVQKNGFVAGYQLFVSQQMMLPSAAFAWSGVLGVSINSALHHSNRVVGWAIVVLFVAAGCAFAVMFRNVAKASRLGKQYRASGSPHEDLPPPTVPPTVALSMISVLAVLVWALDILGIGACLLTAKYSAPRATGGFFVAIGLLLLGLPLTMVRKRRTSQRIG